MADSSRREWGSEEVRYRREDSKEEIDEWVTPVDNQHSVLLELSEIV
jgi:hypothetical protein